MAAEWYLYRKDKRHGPFRLEDLRAALEKGQVFDRDLVKRDSMSTAIPLREALTTFAAPRSGPNAGSAPASSMGSESLVAAPYMPADLEAFDGRLEGLLGDRRAILATMNRHWLQLQQALRCSIALGIEPSQQVAVGPTLDISAQVDARAELTAQCASSLRQTAEAIAQVKSTAASEAGRAEKLARNVGIWGATAGAFVFCFLFGWIASGVCLGILLTAAGVAATRFLAIQSQTWWTPALVKKITSTPQFGVKTDQLHRRLDELENRRSSEGLALAEAAGGCWALQAELLRWGVQKLNREKTQVDELCSRPPVHVLGAWDDSRWRAWQPETRSLFLRRLRVGEYREDVVTELQSQLDPNMVEYAAKNSLPAAYPAFAPFIGENKTIVIACEDHNLDAGLEILHALIVRIASLFPVQGLFTLLDPATHDRAFPMLRQLRNTRNVQDDLFTTLRDIEQKLKHVNREVLGFEKRLDLVAEEKRLGEQFEFVFAANFPEGFDSRCSDSLVHIANSGPPTGRYVIIHYNKSRDTGHASVLAKLKNVHVVSVEREYSQNRWFVPDPAPPEELQRELLARIQAVKPPDTSLGAGVVALGKGERLWEGDPRGAIRTPIAESGTKVLEIAFGKGCVHGLLVGQTGSGKSTLYHTLIYGLSMRYAPDALQFYLIDGKQGVEFQHYLFKNRASESDPARAAKFQQFASLKLDVVLPHIAVVSMNSTPELSCSILKHLNEEFARRNELFIKFNVRDYDEYGDYVAKGGGEGKLPRILLIVDEYQELFEDESVAPEASALLATLAEKGRSAGIHLLLGSQNIGAAGMMQQDRVFGSMQLRIGMKLAEEKLRGLTHFGAEGKQMLRECTERGRVVINNQSGQDGHNQFGKVAFLDGNVRDEWVLKQLEMAATPEFQERPRTPAKVIYGADQPRFLENPCVGRCLASVAKSRRRFTPEELQAMAHGDPSHPAAPGFGCRTWMAAEHPVGLWFGQQLQVHGYALMALRRDVSQNAALIGSTPQTRMGMLTSMMLSSALLYSRDQIAIRTLDGSLYGSPSHGNLDEVHRKYFLPLGYDSVFRNTPDDAEAFMAELLAELGRRTAGHANLGSHLIVLNELERFRTTHRPQGYGGEIPPFYRGLKKLLADGPSYGMHVILSSSTQVSLSQVIDDRGDLARINHRVALQMSAEDSQMFVGSRSASTLQKDGEKPVLGLYVNLSQGKAGQRFKPFSVEHVLEAVSELVTKLKDTTS